MICRFIIKRNGEKVAFERTKLIHGFLKALCTVEDETQAATHAMDACYEVEQQLDKTGFDCTTADTLQVYAVNALRHLNCTSGDLAADAFLKYAAKRRDIRELRHLKKELGELTNSSAAEADSKRENANIDADTAMGTMLKYGSESSRAYSLIEVLPEDIAVAQTNGDIHIHDMDFYNLTETCCQINLGKLLRDGFSTGHGYVREPSNILSAANLTCIVIQSNQNDQHGGQSIPCFDYYLAPYVTKTAIKEIVRCLGDYLWTNSSDNSNAMRVSDEGIKSCVEGFVNSGKSLLDEMQMAPLAEALARRFGQDPQKVVRLCRLAIAHVEEQTYQAMEALVHNLNTMNSRAGAQVPFSSINFGTDTSLEGRLVSKMFMSAIEAGLGNGETSIFPIAIFKIKEGINFEPGAPNYDLYQQALRTTAKRLFPNFSFIDAPFNKQYYKEGHPETEVAYMGCRTRVLGNVYDSSREITEGRGNLSFTSINLPRLGILSKGDVDKFYELLDDRLELVRRQLLHRFQIQSKKTVRNYPFLMGQGVWIDSDKLYIDDEVGDILKHGTLSIGFIGLAECLKALCGKHHGESTVAQQMGLNIIKHMREYVDNLSKSTGLNWSLIATPAEGLAGRFVKIDRKLFGELPGITDKKWYTNSFHIPVEYKISGFKKLELEGPYHELTNGGHISYVELDGDPAKNIEALDQMVHHMRKCNIGYGAINHAVDRDPVCGYTGIIDDVCPLCNRADGEMCGAKVLLDLKAGNMGHTPTPRERGAGVPFARIRRITGYLVGTVDRFNDAKRDELEHRVHHF